LTAAQTQSSHRTIPPMPPPISLPAADIARSLRRQARTLAALPRDAHPGWLSTLGLRAPAPDGAAIAVHARLWLRALGMGDLQALPLTEGLDRLAVLPAGRARQALTLRALLHRRRLLRVGLRPTLSALGQGWVGTRAWQALLHDAPAPLHDAPLPIGDNTRLHTALAWEGWCRLHSEAGSSANPALRLLRLHFARSLTPLAVSPPEPALSHWLARHLDVLYFDDGVEDAT
jgi:hypothetical protein